MNIKQYKVYVYKLTMCAEDACWDKIKLRTSKHLAN